MKIDFTKKTKTISYRYLHFESIGDSDKTVLVKGAYKLLNNKLIKADR